MAIFRGPGDIPEAHGVVIRATDHHGLVKKSCVSYRIKVVVEHFIHLDNLLSELDGLGIKF